MQFCSKCGNEIEEDVKFCPQCGNAVKGSGTTTIIEAFSSEYEILKEIGRGGMSTVYKAKQKRLDRIVALKVVPKEFSHDKKFVKRFQKEARDTARLSHPNIITIHDFGNIGGYPYIAMKYLEGEDLHHKIKQQGTLQESEIKGIILPILGALSYAHEKGIIHRDIKSSNIMFDEKDRPVLMDFGIAKSAEGTKLTKTGTYLGTPEYSSPEQADSEKKVDYRTDIYSMGVLLYELSTGRVPFSSTNPLSVLSDHLLKKPQNPSTINSKLSTGFVNVILKSLAKKPDLRYQDCKQFAKALEEGESEVPESVYASEERSADLKTKKYNKADLDKKRKKKKKGSGLKIAIGLVSVVIVGFLLYLGLGYSRGTVEIPSVVGMQYGDAKKFLHNNDLRVEQGELIKTKNEKDGKVASQHPSSGEAKKGSAIILDAYQRYVDVPEVKNLTESKAREVLAKNDLLLDKVIKKFHLTVDKGKIIKIEKNPRELPENSGVNLVLSRGIEMETLPKLAGKRLSYGKRKLSNLGFELGRVIKVENKYYDESNIIVKSYPEPDRIAKGSTVNLYVSIGNTYLPDLKGLSLIEAKNKLESLGLKAGKEKRIESDIDESNRIVRTNPGNGKLTKDTKVNLYISKGNSYLPNLKGLSLSEAKRKLGSLDLKVGNETVIESDIDESNKIVRTNPSSGKLTNGTKVDLYISQGIIPFKTKRNKLIIKSNSFGIIFINKIYNCMLNPHEQMILENLQAENYKIIFTNGFEKQERVVNLKNGDNKIVNFILKNSRNNDSKTLAKWDGGEITENQLEDKLATIPSFYRPKGGFTSDQKKRFLEQYAIEEIFFLEAIECGFDIKKSVIDSINTNISNKFGSDPKQNLKIYRAVKVPILRQYYKIKIANKFNTKKKQEQYFKELKNYVKKKYDLEMFKNCLKD